jgi:hypothetical protein
LPLGEVLSANNFSSVNQFGKNLYYKLIADLDLMNGFLTQIDTDKNRDKH